MAAKMSTSRTNEYFIPKDGIDREVMVADICRYLGNDTLVRPGNYENPQTRQIQQGYFVTAYSNLNSAMITDLKADSERWEAERQATVSRGLAYLDYRASITHQSRQYYGPTDLSTPPVSSLPSDPYYSRGRAVPPVPDASDLCYGSYYGSSTPNILSESPLNYSSSPPTATNALPIVQHLTPNKKDLPLLLNGNPCRACADFGASANMIDANFARSLGLVIDTNSICPTFELPTRKRLLRPSGKVSIDCEFPREPPSRVLEAFFVVENFVHAVVLGRKFLRETNILDVFRHRLRDRPLEVHDIPVVAFLGVREEGLKFWLDGEEPTSAPDTGSEINVMSLVFARQRGFAIKEDRVHQVQFADRSRQDVEGLVSVPVSFGNGAPPSLLLKLVDVTNYSPAQVRAPDATGAINYGSTASILADFHVLDGLKVDIIFGEDLLATVNAFVRHSTDFNEVFTESSNLATMGLVKKMGQLVCSAVGKQSSQKFDQARERDIADSKELDRYDNEKKRIETLVGYEKERAERWNERKRREYNRRR